MFTILLGKCYVHLYCVDVMIQKLSMTFNITLLYYKSIINLLYYLIYCIMYNMYIFFYKQK